MNKLTPFLLSFALAVSGGLLIAKGRGQEKGNGSSFTGQSHGNGQGSLDRDLGKERATEAGKGKKKGLYKDQYSIGEGKGKNKPMAASGKLTGQEKAKKAKEKNKDQEKHKDNKDKD
jgi:hypothetical protein